MGGAGVGCITVQAAGKAPGSRLFFFIVFFLPRVSLALRRSVPAVGQPLSHGGAAGGTPRPGVREGTGLRFAERAAPQPRQGGVTDADVQDTPGKDSKRSRPFAMTVPSVLHVVPG